MRKTAASLVLFATLTHGILLQASQTSAPMVASMVRELSDHVIAPVFSHSLESATTLDAAAREFCAALDSSSLHALQENWRAAMQAWSAASLFRFGPVLVENIDLKIFYLPLRKSRIKANIQHPPEDMNSISVSARGLAVVEYLVFDRERPVQQILQDLVENSARCEYLEMLTGQLVADNAALAGAWQDAGGFYGNFSGRIEQPYITRQEALGELAGAINQYLASTERNRLGRPAGLPDSQPSPYKAQSWRSGNSIANLQAGLSTLEQILAVDYGLAELLDARGDSDLADRAAQLIQQLGQELEAIQPDLFTAVTESPEPVQQAWSTLDELKKLFEHPISESLGVQPGFSDMDGD